MSTGNKGTSPTPVLNNRIGLTQPAGGLFPPHFSSALQRTPHTPAPAAQTHARRPSAPLAASPIHNIALTRKRKRNVMNHYRPASASAMFLAPMTIKEIFHGNCEKTGG